MPRSLTLDLQVGCPPSFTPNLSLSLEAKGPCGKLRPELQNWGEQAVAPLGPSLSLGTAPRGREKLGVA